MSVIRVQYRRGVSLDALAAEHGLPPGSVRLVARPSRWGNPYTVAEYGRAEAVDRFEDDVTHHRAPGDYNGARPFDVVAWLAPLRGAAALACYCAPGQPCHADVLIGLLEEMSA